MRLNNHCERDEECRASQENSVCSKLLHICQCRSVLTNFVHIQGLKYTMSYLSMCEWWQYLGMDSWSWWTRWRLQCPAPRIRRDAPSPSSWTQSLSGSWRCWGWCSSWSAWCSRCSQGLGEITWHNPSHSNLTIFISEPSFQRTDLFLTLPMHDWWTRHCWKVKNIWERITTLFKVSSSYAFFV